MPWANDGAAVSTVSPVSATGLTDGKCYRWVQTLTNSGGTSGASTSGSVLVDTTAPSGAITAPAANQPLAGDVTISGSATDTGSFKEYQLEYGVGTTPAAWTTIGAIGTTQVPPTGTLGTWSSGSLSGVYTLRLTVRENAGAAASVTSRTVVLENAGRGDEGFLSRVPFELGGGYTLDVGVHNGETRLSRQLFSIPSFGPAGAVDLVYSSLEPGTTGRFGVGWTSNLTQYLTFDATDIVVWHRADGGRVPFGKVGGAWTALAGQHESLAVGGGEYSITSTDQGKVVFADAAGAGRLKRIEDRFGKRLTLVWSTNSATATDASARVTNLAINAADNRITGVTDSAGRAWAFGYSGTGSNSDLTSITDPASKVTTLAYDPSHRLISVARTRSRVAGAPETINWTVGYTAGKATGVTDPVSATVANTFTYTGDSTTVGLLKEAAGPVRNSSTYAFDALGRVTTAADPEGFVTTSAYDTDSNLVSQANPIGTGTATASSTYAYDPKGNVLTEIAPVDGALTVTTASSYNATNDVLTRSEADSDPALKLVTKYSYDGPGHLLGVDVNCTTTGTTPPSTASTCTGAGTADAATNLSTTYTYTSLNQLQDETDPLGRVTRHTYDANGNETSVIANYMSGQSATNERNVTSGEAYAANQAGNAGLPTSTTDPLGRLTTLTYDALGRVLTEVQPGDGSIPVLTRTTTYDEFGNALTETEGWTPLGGGSPVTRTTSHVYDLANRETTTTDPALVATTTGYDAAGNAISGTAAGVTTARTFDGLGRVLSETTDNGTATHTYDAQGNELTSSNAEG